MAAAHSIRRAPSRVRWDRVGRWSLLLVFVLVLLPLRRARPVVDLRVRRGQGAAARGRRAQGARTSALRARRADLRRPAALEREARRLGMVRPGEQPYVVEGLPSATGARPSLAWGAWPSRPRSTSGGPASARLAEAPPEQRAALERVTERDPPSSCAAAWAARSRPTSSPSSTSAGTDWCLDLAVATAPGAPCAWDVRIVADAAFARYLRGRVGLRRRPAGALARLAQSSAAAERRLAQAELGGRGRARGLGPSASASDEDEPAPVGHRRARRRADHRRARPRPRSVRRASPRPRPARSPPGSPP